MILKKTELINVKKGNRSKILFLFNICIFCFSNEIVLFLKLCVLVPEVSGLQETKKQSVFMLLVPSLYPLW